MIELFKHQQEALELTAGLNHVAYYHDQGLGKTYTGAEKLYELDAAVNLVICQKSKVDDWLEHFRSHYGFKIYDLTVKADYENFIGVQRSGAEIVGVINYDLVWRRPELKKLEHFTLMLDESSLIQHEESKRSKFILKLKPDNVILLSGTPTGGKYETLWSQMYLLGWNISKEMYYNTYIDYHYDTRQGFPLRIIDGYKNVDRLKRKMREHGCHFLKTEDCIDLPEQIDQTIYVDSTKQYKKFCKDRIVAVKDKELVGDTTLTKLLYERQLCGQYNTDKLDAFKDLLESTSERVIVFYNFNVELELLERICDSVERPYSLVNGSDKDLYAYDNLEGSVTLIQYQAGAKGLNLQKANRMIFFTPTLSAEDYMQARKRIHRIHQDKTCFYYLLVCKGTVEERIYNTLAKREDYTNYLFESENETWKI